MCENEANSPNTKGMYVHILHIQIMFVRSFPGFPLSMSIMIAALLILRGKPGNEAWVGIQPLCISTQSQLHVVCALHD